MSWEITLFYWTGWFSLTAVLAGIGIIGSRLLWMIYNTKESAFYANTAMLAAYIKYAYKYRFRNVDPKNIERFQVDGYEITVEKVESNKSEECEKKQ